MSKVNIILLDDINNIKEEVDMIKPKTFLELSENLRIKFENLPEYFEMFILDKNNKELKISNQENYNLIEDILFIREINNDILQQSMFDLNLNRLSESKQELFESKYRCILCSQIIKQEKPYFCYKCQNIYHEKCLKDWDIKCKQQNNQFHCPSCRNVLPIELWSKKLNYEENRNDDAYLLNKINELKLEKNMNNNISIIKDKKINELLGKINNNELINIYQNYIKKTIEIFKNVLNKINSIHSLLKFKVNNKLNDILTNFPLNLNNLEVDDISNIINEELEQFENYIINNIINKNKIMNIKEHNMTKIIKKKQLERKNIQNFNIIKHKYKDPMKENELNDLKKEKYINTITLIYVTESKGNYDILGKKFVDNNENNIDLIINGKKNILTNNYELKEGKNIISLLIKKKLTNLSYMFICCKSLNDISELRNLDVKDVTIFGNMFFECSSLSNIKPLENWNVSNGKDFSFLFFGCTSLSDIKPLENWNISNGNNFQSMFHGCTSLSDITPLQNWKFQNVNNFQNMFTDCNSLSDIKPLQNWNVSGVNNFSYMFSYCYSLSDIRPLENWNVKSSNYMSCMFFKCKKLFDVKPLENWDVSNCNDFQNMFNGCSPLLDIKPLEKWKVPKDMLKDIK